MAHTYDLATDVGKMRLDIGDTDVAELGVRAIFSDEELASLRAGNRSRKLASAAALDIIATKLAQVMRDMTSQDVSTFGSRTAESVRKQAAVLREQGNIEAAGEVLVW